MLFNLILSLVFLIQQPDPYSGRWVSVDDETGKEKSEIGLYVEGKKLYSRINALLLAKDQGKICEAC